MHEDASDLYRSTSGLQLRLSRLIRLQLKKNNNIISIPIVATGLRGLRNNYLCGIIPKHSNI